MRIGVWLVAAACSGGGDTEDSDPGACGDVTAHDLVVVGRVVRGNGAAAGSATVELEDRGWEPGTVIGVATTDGSGAFSMDAIGVTSVEDCWGTLLDYVLVASDGEAAGEMAVNQPLYGAIQDGSLEVDLTATPIEIE